MKDYARVIVGSLLAGSLLAGSLLAAAGMRPAVYDGLNSGIVLTNTTGPTVIPQCGYEWSGKVGFFCADW